MTFFVFQTRFQPAAEPFGDFLPKNVVLALRSILL